MPLYQISLRSSRMHEQVQATLMLRIDASSFEEAEDCVRNSIPGYDWKRWTSLYGVQQIDPQPPTDIHNTLAELKPQTVKPA